MSVERFLAWVSLGIFAVIAIWFFPNLLDFLITRYWDRRK